MYFTKDEQNQQNVEDFMNGLGDFFNTMIKVNDDSNEFTDFKDKTTSYFDKEVKKHREFVIIDNMYHEDEDFHFVFYGTMEECEKEMENQDYPITCEIKRNYEYR